jgi:hypothetical protein
MQVWGWVQIFFKIADMKIDNAVPYPLSCVVSVCANSLTHYLPITPALCHWNNQVTYHSKEKSGRL